MTLKYIKRIKSATHKNGDFDGTCEQDLKKLIVDDTDFYLDRTITHLQISYNMQYLCYKCKIFQYLS